MVWRETKTSEMRAIQVDNHRCLLGTRRIDRIPNARAGVLCGVKKRDD